MQKLRETVLNLFNFIGDYSGCHQMPERCFTVKHYTFPICARCTGVSVGQLLTVLLLPFGVTIGVWWAFLLAVVMLADWSLQFFGLLQSTNPRRFVTGIMGGVGCWSLGIHAIKAVWNWF